MGASVVGLHETYTIRRGPASIDPAHDLLRQARARRIDNEHIRATGALDELAQRQAYIAREEAGVVDLVEPGVRDRVGDRLLDQLEPPDLTGARRHQQPDRADPAVQVVDAIGGRRRGVLDREPVQPLGHLGVGLEERVRGDPHPHAADLLLEPVAPGDQLRLAALGGLSDAVEPGPQQTADRLGRPREAVAIDPPGARHQPDLELAASPALAHHQIPQHAFAGTPVIRNEALRPAPLHDPLARRVPVLGGEQAVGDLDDLIPAARRVEATDEPVAGTGAERILELVPVSPRLDGLDDRLELESVETADPSQGIPDLRMLGLELALVGQHLPRRPGVRGARLHALRTGLEHLDRPGLGVGAL